MLADGLGNISGIHVVNKVETNIVVLDIEKLKQISEQFVEALKKEGVLANTFGPISVRFVTHFDVTSKEINKTISIIKKTADVFHSS